MTQPNFQRGAKLSVVIKQVLPEAGLLVSLSGGWQGFIHVSELIGNLRDYTIGRTISAVVLDSNPETGRVALTTADVDWRSLRIDQDVTGWVVGISNDRALVFVDIGADIDASIHISQLSDTRRVNDPSEEVQIGQRIRARVDAIDPARNRVNLSLRARQQPRR